MATFSQQAQTYFSGVQPSGILKIFPKVPTPTAPAINRTPTVTPTRTPVTTPVISGAIPSAGGPVRPAIAIDQTPSMGVSNLMGTATPGGGSSSISPTFSVQGGTAATGPGAGSNDYTWLLYVAAGVGLLLVTLYSRKGHHRA